MTRALLIAILCTCFSLFNIPVFWQILVLYFILHHNEEATYGKHHSLFGHSCDLIVSKYAHLAIEPKRWKQR